MVSIYMWWQTGQGRGRVGQGGQGRHPPTGPVGGPQQPSGWSLCLWRRFWGVGEGRGRWSSGRKIGSSLSVTNLSLPHPPRWARLVEIRECWAGSGRNPGVSGRVRLKSGSVTPSLSVTDLSLPHPPCRARSAWMSGPVIDRRGALCTRFTLVGLKPNPNFHPYI